MTLSNTQFSILAQAALDPSGRVVSPANLPPGARASIARALLNAGLVARAEPSDDGAGWKLDGEILALRITEDGRRAVAEVKSDLTASPKEEPSAADTPDTSTVQLASGSEKVMPSPSPAPRSNLRDSAVCLLAKWDATTEREQLEDAIAALHGAIKSTPRLAGSARKPREGTKREVVLNLLRRSEGATIASVMEATGWAQHTVRGFFAGLKKKGHAVEVLDRVQQVRSGNAGAKGSYSIYRLGEAG